MTGFINIPTFVEICENGYLYKYVLIWKPVHRLMQNKYNEKIKL